MNNEEGKKWKKVGALNKEGVVVSKVKARGVSREWKGVSREERRDRVGMSEMGKEVVRLSKAERAFMSKKLGGGTVAECVKAAGWKVESKGNMSWRRWMNEKMERYEAVVMNKEGGVVSKVKARGVSREWKGVSREERRDRVGMSEMGKEVVRLSKAERAFMSKKRGGGTVAECVKAAGWIS